MTRLVMCGFHIATCDRYSMSSKESLSALHGCSCNFCARVRQISRILSVLCVFVAGKCGCLVRM